jgi:hypothetical protein
MIFSPDSPVIKSVADFECDALDTAGPTMVGKVMDQVVDLDPQLRRWPAHVDFSNSGAICAGVPGH